MLLLTHVIWRWERSSLSLSPLVLPPFIAESGHTQQQPSPQITKLHQLSPSFSLSISFHQNYSNLYFHNMSSLWDKKLTFNFFSFLMNLDVHTSSSPYLHIPAGSWQSVIRKSAQSNLQHPLATASHKHFSTRDHVLKFQMHELCHIETKRFWVLRDKRKTNPQISSTQWSRGETMQQRACLSSNQMWKANSEFKCESAAG